MSEVLFYDEWSKLLKEDCSVEIINKCPNDGYWSIENIETVLNQNIDIVNHIPKSVLYSDRIVNFIVEQLPAKVIELPIEFSERLSIEQLGRVIIKHSKYSDTYLSRVKNKKRKSELKKYIDDNTVIDKERIERCKEIIPKLQELQEKSPNILKMLSEIMDEMIVNGENGMNLINELEQSLRQYGKKELEQRCLKYFLEKDKLNTELISRYIK